MKRALGLAEKSMDPVGILVVVGMLFVTKFTSVEFTAEEVLWASLAAGALRTVFEGWRRQRHAKQLEEARSTPGMRTF